MIAGTVGGCTILVDAPARWLCTYFPDGSALPAAPEDTPEYRATAEALGYGPSVWDLCRDHEITHSWLAARRGQPQSPTLWAVARGDKHLAPDAVRAAEEADVLALQRFLRTGGACPELYRVAHEDEWPAVLRGLAETLRRFGAEVPARAAP